MRGFYLQQGLLCNQISIPKLMLQTFKASVILVFVNDTLLLARAFFLLKMVLGCGENPKDIPAIIPCCDAPRNDR